MPTSLLGRLGRKSSKKAESQREPSESFTLSLQQARTLQAQGRFDDALKEYEAALKQLVTTKGSIELGLGVQEEIASIQLRRGDLPAAEEGFRNQYKMRKKNMGAGDRVTLGAALNLARVYVEGKRTGDATALIQSNLVAYDEKDGRDCRQKFEAMACLGDVYTIDGRAEDACTLYQKALSGLEATSGPDDQHACDTKFSLAMANALTGRYIKAADLLKELISRIETNAIGGDRNILRARGRLGRIYVKMSRITDAEIELSRCLEESVKLSMRDDKYALEASQDLLELYSLHGETDGVTAVRAWINGEDVAMCLFIARKKNPSKIDHEEPLNQPRPAAHGEDESFNRIMKIRTSDDKFEPVVALLDTQCQRGNWVSIRLIERLNLVDRIATEVSAPELDSGTGHSVEAIGAIELSWLWYPNGTRMYDGQFFVFKDGAQFDAIIGVEYIVREGLLRTNASAFIPLTENINVKDDRHAIALAEEKQRQDKKALEARRAASRQASQQPSNTQSSGSGQ